MKIFSRAIIMAAVMSMTLTLSAFAGDAPSGVSIESSGADITVSWSEPDFDGVDKYQVQILKKSSSSTGNDTTYKTITTDSDETSVDVTVTQKGYFRARVRARDVNNKWHDWSEKTDTVTVKSEDVGKGTGSGGTSTVVYTQNYTGGNASYNLNGTTYNTMTWGPTAGNLANTGLTTLSDPTAMNPTTNGVYSSSSSVVNSMKVVANTYAHDGWQFENNGMWYLNPDGTYPVSTWKEIDGEFYHFNPSGYLEVNTWVLESNQKWRYVGADAKMSKGWKQILGKWYYFSLASGELQGPGLITVDGKYYYIDRDGARVENSIVGGYYYGADGALTNG
ncbi:fibronectin type III domain-containing protein [Oribacterium sp. P6A1]|uniref:fibronectin type III domain-containing protein n=1 Tax=Oribacterium sp. P6A1 TaxID=1410612 RepID=UPI000564BF51|nr:fibronectin type III domain-containing protein [Oribacterium sp. P6A1]